MADRVGGGGVRVHGLDCGDVDAAMVETNRGAETGSAAHKTEGVVVGTRRKTGGLLEASGRDSAAGMAGLGQPFQ